MDKIRVAIIGSGGIANGAHAPAYVANADLCELVACADVDLAAAQKLAEKHHCTAYGDVTAMLDAEQPDAVSICTPPVGHLPNVRLAAERGIAILCEKPMTRNLPEANEMVALVQATGVPFMTAFCHRFHGPVPLLKALIDQGKLGTVMQYYNRFSGRFAGVEQRWFSQAETAGGGNLMDTTVHSIDIFRFLIGEVRAISAQTRTVLPIAVEDTATLLVRSESGVLGELSCSWVTQPGEAVIRVYGTEGTAEIDYGADPSLRYWSEGAWIQVPYAGPDRFYGEVRHFLECVRDGLTPSITVHDGARAIALLDAAYRSAGGRA